MALDLNGESGGKEEKDSKAVKEKEKESVAEKGSVEIREVSGQSISKIALRTSRGSGEVKRKDADQMVSQIQDVKGKVCGYLTIFGILTRFLSLRFLRHRSHLQNLRGHSKEETRKRSVGWLFSVVKIVIH